MLSVLVKQVSEMYGTPDCFMNYILHGAGVNEEFICCVACTDVYNKQLVFRTKFNWNHSTLRPTMLTSGGVLTAYISCHRGVHPMGACFISDL